VAHSFFYTGKHWQEMEGCHRLQWQDHLHFPCMPSDSFFSCCFIASIICWTLSSMSWCLSCAGRLEKREAEQRRTVHRVSCTSTRSLLGLESGGSGIFCWDRHQLSFDTASAYPRQFSHLLWCYFAFR